MSHRYLLFERDSLSYHCDLICEGIQNYFMERDSGTTLLPLDLCDLDTVDLGSSDFELGVVCWLDRLSSMAGIRDLGIPYLNLRESDAMSNIGARITFEGEGTAAARYLIEEAGIRSLAFIGLEHSFSHRRRFNEFQEEATRQGIIPEPHFFQSRFIDAGAGGPLVFDRKLVSDRNRQLSELLQRIPKPAGIFCGDDHMALNLYYRAQMLGVEVPEQVSIVGVGSPQRAEEGGVQSISVVSIDWIRQGYLAAEMLDQYLSGQKTGKSVRSQADGIIHRDTTARRTISDALVHRAFQLIDQDRRITVTELSQRLTVSRRTLGEHFLTTTGMSVSKAIDLERFRHAKELLKSKNYSHEAIATQAGYHNHKQMIRSFDRFVQMSPKQYAQAYLTPKGSK